MEGYLISYSAVSEYSYRIRATLSGEQGVERRDNLG